MCSPPCVVIAPNWNWEFISSVLSMGKLGLFRYISVLGLPPTTLFLPLKGGAINTGESSLYLTFSS